MSPDPIHLQLAGDEDRLHFDVLGDGAGPEENDAAVTGIAERIVEILSTQPTGLGFTELRKRVAVRGSAVSEALRELEAAGRAHQNSRIWRLSSVPATSQTHDAERNGASHQPQVDDRTNST